MTADKLADAILNKCDIYYDGALISKEAYHIICRQMMTSYLRFSPMIWFSSRGNAIVGREPDFTVGACA